MLFLLCIRSSEVPQLKSRPTKVEEPPSTWTGELKSSLRIFQGDFFERVHQRKEEGGASLQLDLSSHETDLSAHRVKADTVASLWELQSSIPNDPMS